MSCIRFSTPAQRKQLARHAPTMQTLEQGVARPAAPPVTASKLRRLRLLAADADPRIRESAALNPHLPADSATALAADDDAGVRAGLARNQTIASDLLRGLARDESATVRGWVAVNAATPADALCGLAEDADETVRALVAWRASFAGTLLPA